MSPSKPCEPLRAESAQTENALAGSAAFSFYVEHAPSYGQAFGTLGAVMLLLTWLFLSAFSVLFGAELNAELERQTTRDTTAGADLPAGQRGAAAADATP
ncbi:YihY/virulence factor BrkB family protein [Methylorubrum extorquens]